MGVQEMDNAPIRTRSCIANLARVTILVATVVFDAAGSGLTEDDARLRTALELLRSDDPSKVVRGIRIAGQLEKRGAAAVPLLVQKLGDSRDAAQNAKFAPWVPSISDKAKLALLSIGKPAVPALTKLVAETDDTEIVVSAIDTLARIGPEAQSSLDVVTTASHSSDDAIRLYAVDALAKIDPEGSESVPHLVDALDAKDPDIRSRAVLGLGRIGRKAAPAIPKLLTMLDSEDWRTEWYTPDSAGGLPLRVDVVESLGKIGAREEVVVEKLTPLLNHEDPLVRAAVASACSKLSDEPKLAISVLTEVIADSRNPKAKRFAARGLGDLGPEARCAANHLMGLLDDKENASLRSAAVKAIAAIRPPHYFSVLVRASKDDHFIVRATALEAIGNHGLEQDKALQLLRKGLDDGYWCVQFNAVDALAKMGPKAKPALPRLREMAASDETYNREKVRQAIKRIEGDNEMPQPMK